MGDRRDRPNGDALWRAVIAGVKPLDRRPARSPEPPPERPPDAVNSVPPQSPRIPQAKRKSQQAPPPLVHGTVAGLDRRTAERLRRGKLPFEARLDLHGHTREDAHRALTAFLEHSRHLGRRAVIVVTGKGQGVLQRAVPRWLNEPRLRACVLAFAYAQPRHGGDGALYVYLKKPR